MEHWTITLRGLHVWVADNLYSVVFFKIDVGWLSVNLSWSIWFKLHFISIDCFGIMNFFCSFAIWIKTVWKWLRLNLHEWGWLSCFSDLALLSVGHEVGTTLIEMRRDWDGWTFGFCGGENLFACSYFRKEERLRVRALPKVTFTLIKVFFPVIVN